ncbi:LOB domain-containing protein [Striga asiatica]|uniref:LOB domain-containing protein n=1 Tax=Striga asiatica TaxID=4170 RepID=A0A5A7R067_STRAF|nr:LOB domain-containing protein [Striga asiatica]
MFPHEAETLHQNNINSKNQNKLKYLMEVSEASIMMISNSNNSPCAACKILRRKCVQKCVLAPYFPPNDPLKFTIAHRVFGASNIIKFLQELPEPQRADAVSSMVYEANARLRDPVYGCAGSISQLQMQVSQLQQQLAKAQAQILNLQCQHSTLISLYSMDALSNDLINSFNDFNSSPHTSFMEDNNIGLLLDPLWT